VILSRMNGKKRWVEFGVVRLFAETERELVSIATLAAGTIRILRAECKKER